MRRVPPPFVAYLRVYEPLRAFGPQPRARLERALAAGALPPTEAGPREREVWLRTQVATPPRMLPGDRADGTAGDGPLLVLSLDPAEVPGADRSGGVLVCPLDVRTRAAAALVGFLATASPWLVRVALPVGPRAATDAMRTRAQTVTSELGSSAVHVVSSTWTVPLPWFALVDPATRRLDPLPRPDQKRRVCYRTTIGDAVSRASRAHTVVQRAIGDSGPGRVLADTARWLGHFHAGSAVELDYGGLVQLMDDESLQGDTSAPDVHAAVDAMESGDADELAARYERLRDFWTRFAVCERFG
ncbi:MAG TPA: hypothetical protein VGJ95_01765 [Pseudonocardiaceae bacterium]|jgi:hypothetical protein